MAGAVVSDNRLQVQSFADGFVVANYRNVTIAVWGSSVTEPLVARFGENCRTLAKNYSRFSTVQVVVGGAGLPSSEVRTQLLSLQDELSPQLACAGIWVAGTGFWAGALRGIVTGMHHLNPPPFKAIACATMDELVHWLVPLHGEATGIELPPEGLRAAIVEVVHHPSVADRAKAVVTTS